MTDFRFVTPLCPNCGHPAAYITEELIAHAELDLEEDGGYRYNGGSRVGWDTQVPVVNDGCVTLHCGSCSREWETETIKTKESPHG